MRRILSIQPDYLDMDSLLELFRKLNNAGSACILMQQDGKLRLVASAPAGLSQDCDYGVLERCFEAFAADDQNAIDGISDEEDKAPPDQHTAVIPMWSMDLPKKVTGVLQITFCNDGESIALDREPVKECYQKICLATHLFMKEWRKKERLFRIVFMLCEICDRKEPFLFSRLYCIHFWCDRICRAMGCTKEELEKIEFASLMHELGRLYIDDAILNKQEKLTDEESVIMRNRIILSYDIARILETVHSVEGLPELILCCQERYDGLGYPENRIGEQIPFLSRVLYVAKAISAMLTNSIHRRKKTISETVEELKLGSGTQFDPAIVEVAIQLLIEGKAAPGIAEGSMGSFGTMVIRHDKHRTSVRGTIRRREGKYEFHPIHTELTLHPSVWTGRKAEMYLNVSDEILQYSLKIGSVRDNVLELSGVELVSDLHSFSIRWLMEGVFITDRKKQLPVYIVLLGGDYIDFYFFTQGREMTLLKGVIKLLFEDGKSAFLSGIVTQNEVFDDRQYCRLQYVGIKESDRKVVFSEMFKMQIKRRKETWSLNMNYSGK